MQLAFLNQILEAASKSPLDFKAETIRQGEIVIGMLNDNARRLMSLSKQWENDLQKIVEDHLFAHETGEHESGSEACQNHIEGFLKREAQISVVRAVLIASLREDFKCGDMPGDSIGIRQSEDGSYVLVRYNELVISLHGLADLLTARV